MNEKEYREMFSQLHSSVQEEAIVMKTKPTRRFRFASVPLAAALILILTVGVAFAGVYNNRIQDLVMSDNDGYDLSLQGFADSPECKATQEWLAFEEKYEKEHEEEIDALKCDFSQVDEKYIEYSVYTKEMADKIDAICKKYNLKLHSDFHTASANKMYKKFGKFSSNKDGDGYFYKDGTFQLDCDATVNGQDVDYSFRRTMKGVLEEAYFNVENINKYKQWEYKTACGETVLLALADDHGLILCDYVDCFAVVNVGSDYNIKTKTLEELADSFDFSVLGKSTGATKGGAAKGEAAKVQEEQTEATSNAETEFGFACNPVDDPDATITKAFGMAFGKMHNGIDIGASEGAPINAVADGKVTVPEPNKAYGNYVIIEHDNGWSTLYANCKSITAKDGEQVKAGQQIATVGSIGAASGPHLHFELRDDSGEPVDPEPYYNK